MGQIGDIIDKEAVVQNLRDAGCDSELIDKFVKYYEECRTQDVVMLLSEHRDALLDNMHREQKRIDCLDYLIYKLELQKEVCCLKCCKGRQEDK